uniref:NADH-ubiquinone oxidoreductase chain 4 n=1 Tax=Ceratosolen solmsi TaxID=142686 RepID=I1SVF9_9HYME|nr:NADH dehydrogenase subunit 4 [Ceratosolen solmsi]
MMSMVMYMLGVFFIFYLFHKKLVLKMLGNLMFLLSFIMLFNFGYNKDWSMVYYWMGFDSFSFILVLLSFWILGLMFFVSHVNQPFFYGFILLFLMLSLMISFSSMNYFIFYLFFEVSLVPIFILILGWGYQSERLSAALYLMFYCLFGSLPLLIVIFLFFDIFGTLHYELISWSLFSNNFIYYFMIFGFLVKLPMFFFHSWLPKAHVESPIAGSMILAGVLLKLGGYGLYRSMMIMMKSGVEMNFIFISISLLGVIYLSLVCLRQIDMKILVAYSSVVHMGIMLMSMMTMTIWGFYSGLIMMVGHGLCSSALFVIVNYFYERTHSRNIMINKGMFYLLPSLCMWWFIFCSINMSAPISLNLVSEVMAVCCLLSWSKYLMIFLMLGVFFSSIYSIYLFAYSFHGKSSSLLLKIYPNNINNFIVMLLHWIPLNFLILKMELFL